MNANPERGNKGVVLGPMDLWSIRMRCRGCIGMAMAPGRTPSVSAQPVTAMQNQGTKSSVNGEPDRSKLCRPPLSSRRIVTLKASEHLLKKP